MNTSPSPLTAETVYHKEGNTIFFGEYPQTVKHPDVIIDENTTDARGYYPGGDGCFYAKVTAWPDCETTCVFSSGATFQTDDICFFKVEPIRWRILKDDGEKYFLLADSILKNRWFAHASNNYEQSIVRAFLNQEFYHIAFSTQEQEWILNTVVDNGPETTGWPDTPFVCRDTEDKIFLPSYSEVVNEEYGFSPKAREYDEARQMLVSDYAKALGCYVVQTNDRLYYDRGCWWLRSPAFQDIDYARVVWYHGGVDCLIEEVSELCTGVVPALYLKK